MLPAHKKKTYFSSDDPHTIDLHSFECKVRLFAHEIMQKHKFLCLLQPKQENLLLLLILREWLVTFVLRQNFLITNL